MEKFTFNTTKNAKENFKQTVKDLKEQGYQVSQDGLLNLFFDAFKTEPAQTIKKLKQLQ